MLPLALRPLNPLSNGASRRGPKKSFGTAVMRLQGSNGDYRTFGWTNPGEPVEMKHLQGRAGFRILRVILDGTVVFFGDAPVVSYEAGPPVVRTGGAVTVIGYMGLPNPGEPGYVPGSHGPLLDCVQIGLLHGGVSTGADAANDGRLLASPTPGTPGYGLGKAVLKPIVYGAVLGVPVGALMAAGGGIAWASGAEPTWAVRGLKVMGVSIAALWTIGTVDKYVMKLPTS